jgi:hypothetical protein
MVDGREDAVGVMDYDWTDYVMAVLLAVAAYFGTRIFVVSMWKASLTGLGGDWQ